MASDFLQYWKPHIFDYNVSDAYISETDDKMSHTAGSQLKRVRTGDRVWCITIKNKKLLTVGYVRADKVLGEKAAKKFIGEGAYESDCHVVCVKKPVTKKVVDITSLVPKLRFVGTVAKLPASFAGQNFQTMRRLTPEAALLLENFWKHSPGGFLNKSSAAVEANEETIPYPVGAGFGSPEDNKKVEQAAIRYVKTIFTDDGWRVESVESEKCGYDLHCTRGKDFVEIEVKGVRGTEPIFFVTANEVARARKSYDYLIYIVTSALSRDKGLFAYSGDDFLKKYRLKAISYRADPVGS